MSEIRRVYSDDFGAAVNPFAVKWLYGRLGDGNGRLNVEHFAIGPVQLVKFWSLFYRSLGLDVCGLHGRLGAKVDNEPWAGKIKMWLGEVWFTNTEDALNTNWKNLEYYLVHRPEAGRREVIEAANGNGKRTTPLVIENHPREEPDLWLATADEYPASDGLAFDFGHELDRWLEAGVDIDKAVARTARTLEKALVTGRLKVLHVPVGDYDGLNDEVYKNGRLRVWGEIVRGINPADGLIAEVVENQTGLGAMVGRTGYPIAHPELLRRTYKRTHERIKMAEDAGLLVVDGTRVRRAQNGELL